MGPKELDTTEATEHAWGSFAKTLDPNTESPSIAIARDGGAVYGGRGYQVLAQLLLEEDFFSFQCLSPRSSNLFMGKLTGTNERMVTLPHSPDLRCAHPPARAS